MVYLGFMEGGMGTNIKDSLSFLCTKLQVNFSSHRKGKEGLWERQITVLTSHCCNICVVGFHMIDK